ncbi:amidase [Beauveria brongniartii RCEF 3172]|uniref:Amidase n=1 Tax=Beauveria brongniartii RCEF 3172 TaxID=1081107 RepID=A0A167D3X6_9HYPO|nr:amidase [Beauveria brongniartii RCEF 3172]
MRIACLQFAPQLAAIERNVERADAILGRADPQDIDLLVLPELAFSGYNFKSLGQISPHLELGEFGITAAWSRQVALKYDCAVIAGYPEKIDPVHSWPADPEYYNSAIIIDGDGSVVGNYRKSHLYYTDETWALEGRDGFFTGHVRGLGQLVVGICMDINPYRFEAPWEAFEFSSHALQTGARLIVLSMAWCTHADQQEFFLKPEEPDMDTLLYWITRLQPIISIDFNQETIIVFGNRCGAEGDTTYVGTSTVIGVLSGEILLYGILGRGEESLLVVDTDAQPYAKIKLQSSESVQTQDQVEDDLASQSLPQTDPSDKQRDARGSESRATNGTEPNQATTTDVPEHTLDTIKVTREAEGNSHYDHDWLEPSRRPREHPTSGPFRVDGSSVGLASSSSHVSYTQFTQSHVVPPATRQHDMGEMRPTMSDGDYHRNRMDDFSESDDELLLYDSCAESDEEGWPSPQESQLRGAERYHVAASTQREHGVPNAGKRLPSTHQSQPGLPSPQSEQGATSQSSLVHRIASFALAHEVSPTPNTENFSEEDIYRHVHGKNLTSEHHIRYHTRLLREKLARQGLSAEATDQEEDMEEGPEECQEREKNEVDFDTYQDPDKLRHAGRRTLELASPTRGRAGLETQPNYTLKSVTETRQPAWQEHPAEPTPIVDSPMSHMTLFSPTRTRRRHARQAPAYATAVPGRAGAVAVESSMDVDERAVNQARLPVLGRSKAKENSIPLLDPSRRPKAAARQVPPLRLVPREAPQGKEREVRERSRRTPRQLPTAREMKGPVPRDSGGDNDRHMGRKTPVPMVLVYEGEERVYAAS